MQVLLLQLQARRVLLMPVPWGGCRMPRGTLPRAVHSSSQPWLPPACRGDGEAVKHFCQPSPSLSTEQLPADTARARSWGWWLRCHGGEQRTSRSRGMPWGYLGSNICRRPRRAVTPVFALQGCAAAAGLARGCLPAPEIPTAAGLQQREAARLDFWFVALNFHLGMRRHLPGLLGSQQAAPGEWSLGREGSGWTHSRCPKGPAFTL